MVRGNAVEPVFDILAGDGVERPRQPVVETEPDDLAVEKNGPGRAIGIGSHVVLEGVRQERHGPGAGTVPGRVGPAGDRAEHLLGHLPRPFRRDLAVAAQDDALVGRFPAAAGAVADDEGLDAGGLHAHPEAGEPVVPGDPGLVARFEGIDGALGQGQLVQRDAFGGCLCHAIGLTRPRPSSAPRSGRRSSAPARAVARWSSRRRSLR